MPALFLHLRAPFAAFRGMQAGVYRSTMPTLPYSAAWGLVLNLAGVETRKPGEVATLIDPGAPPLRLCVGVVTAPEVAVLYQQLHAYPVGNSSKGFAEKTFGAKYHIAPVRREVLVGLDVVVGVESADEALLARVRRGLDGELEGERYGLPFAGDNNLIFDRLEVLGSLIASRWYTPVQSEESPRRGSCRLTVGIDRADSSRTRTLLVAPLAQPKRMPPDDAWVWTPRDPTST